MRNSTAYTVLFAALISIVCGVFVSYAAVTLKERQEINALLDKQKKVLQAAGRMENGEDLAPEEVEERFRAFDAVVIDLQTGEPVEGIDPEQFDQRKAASDPATSRDAPNNLASVGRLPNHALVYEVRDDSGNLELTILPIEGLGLWGTLYGFLALEGDANTVRGITYYEHKETPGLGGEVDNPRWKALWPGRQIFDDQGEVAVEVIKGNAPPAVEAPYVVDGLSGATITSRGVTNMLRFWLGENGFEPYLERVRDGRLAA